MGRRRVIVPLLVGAVDGALVAVGPWGIPVWGAALAGLAALVAALVAAVRPTAGFVAAQLAVSAVALPAWTAFRLGRAGTSRRGAVLAAVAASAGLGARLAMAADGRAVTGTVMSWLVLLVLPLLAGRLLAQHARLLAEQRAAAASRERLRIARDLHDALGHRLGVLAVQAAALETESDGAAGPRGLAETARRAVDDLHRAVARMRVGLADIPPLAREFGAGVELRTDGGPRPVAPEVEEAAYRLVQEGLTNAARHAPAAPVAVTLTWEADALLVAVTNPAPPAAGAAAPGGGGRGLAGLDERIRAAGGLLTARQEEDGGFRLSALLPLATPRPA
ncbi:sensor histidine kinase, partial [Mangrovactinospora gilvigrisea]|uniref:sensor histidine kinase n=1 Tax=Mangrovactinospora gilvigrisea TaxID=1428644 RepID=UPI000B0ED7BA